MYYESELYHHGIRGQKWGVRRYQNPDGSLTNAGKRRYGTEEAFEAKKQYKNLKKEYNKAYSDAYRHNNPYSLSTKEHEDNQRRWEKVYDKANDQYAAKKKYESARESAKSARKEARNDPDYKKK